MKYITKILGFPSSCVLPGRLRCRDHALEEYRGKAQECVYLLRQGQGQPCPKTLPQALPNTLLTYYKLENNPVSPPTKTSPTVSSHSRTLSKPKVL